MWSQVIFWLDLDCAFTLLHKGAPGFYWRDAGPTVGEYTYGLIPSPFFREPSSLARICYIEESRSSKEPFFRVPSSLVRICYIEKKTGSLKKGCGMSLSAGLRFSKRSVRHGLGARR